MDLNELLHQHQAAVMRASVAGNNDERDNHFAKVAEYADRVRQLRDVQQPKESHHHVDAPGTIIYGSYAGPPALEPPVLATESWEDEGGALIPPPQVPLPDGVTSKIVRQFVVGPYTYTDFSLALAEHDRRNRSPTGKSANPRR